jgi:uncharacterized protein (TIGR02588 family)
MKQSLSYSNKFKRQPRKLAEWITFLISLSILALIVGLVLHSWRIDSDEPPILQVTETSEVREIKGKFYVPFSILNAGGETAEAVQIVGEMQTNGQVEQVGEQQIDYLSAGEKQEGAFVLSRDPRQEKFNMRIASYKLP